MTREISAERKTAYYVGTGIMVCGGLLFASTFVTFAMHFGDFTDFAANAPVHDVPRFWRHGTSYRGRRSSEELVRVD